MEKHYEEKDQTPTLIDGGQVDEAIVNQAPIDKGVFNVGITATQIKQVVGDVGGSGGTEVVANPSGTATETLTKLQVEDKVYGIPADMEVLELSSSSGTLTNEQYAKVSGDNCIIKYTEGQAHSYFYKRNELLGTIYYVRLLGFGLSEGAITSTSDTINISTADKTYTIIEETAYIEANPTLAGTESSLTGLQVGNTKYKVGGGTQLYKHTITTNSTNNVIQEIYIINDSATEITTIYQPVFNEAVGNAIKISCKINNVICYDIIYIGWEQDELKAVSINPAEPPELSSQTNYDTSNITDVVSPL